MKILKLRESKIIAVILILLGGMLYWRVSGTLDMKFYYSVQEAEAALAGMNNQTIETYINHQYVDAIYLLAYSALFLSIMLRFSRNPFLLWLMVLPGIFDFIETWTILGVLHESICVPEWLGLITAIKWSLAALVIALLIFKARGQSSPSPSPS